MKKLLYLILCAIFRYRKKEPQKDDINDGVELENKE